MEDGRSYRRCSRDETGKDDTSDSVTTFPQPTGHADENLRRPTAHILSHKSGAVSTIKAPHVVLQEGIYSLVQTSSESVEARDVSRSCRGLVVVLSRSCLGGSVLFNAAGSYYIFHVPD